MKKKVKSLIIAASVAAIAGIGAVSFAAWDSNVSTTATGSGTTGNVTISNGFFKDSEGNNKQLTLNETGKLLMPQDQPDDALNGGVKALTYAIPDFQISGSYTLTLTVTAKKGEAAYTLPTDTKIQYKVNGEVWVDAGTAEATTVESTEYATVTGKTLTIQLVSSNVNDMDVSFDITLTYADAATA